MNGSIARRPAVSVVIPTRNRSNLIDVQLVALARQQYEGAIEVIVADNGSTDGTAEHILGHPLREQLSMRYVDASAQRGVSYARNTGADHASTEILLFCDDDDRVHQNWISGMVEFLESDHDVVGSAVEISTLNDRQQKWKPTAPPKPFYAPALSGCSLACRAPVYRKLGGMDLTWESNEDVQFGWRAHRDGFRVAWLADELVAYRTRNTFKASYRQGRARAIGVERMKAEFPEHGLGSVRLVWSVLGLCRYALTPRLPAEERGLLFGFLVGGIIGGLRYRTLKL